MNRILLLLVTLVLSKPVFAQLEIDRGGEQPVIPTWESYESAKYGTVGASLYTGTVNYTIPLYTYQDQDFKVPIFLEYATNGFRVNHSSGQLGHGWSLSGMGRITRKIRGIPDDHVKRTDFIFPIDDMPYNYYYCDVINLCGYDDLSGSHNYGVCPLYKYNDPFFRVFISNRDLNSHDYYEMEPDEFSFDFCGYSGSFHLVRDGEPGNHQCVLYDVSGESRSLKIKFINDLNHYDGSFDTIEIRDAKGYKYQFTRIEYYREALSAFGTPKNPQMYEVTLAWGLENIQAPNGRKMTFSYKRRNSDDSINPDDRIYTPQLCYYYMSINHVCPPPRPVPEFFHCQKIYKHDLENITFGDGTRVYLHRTSGSDEKMIADTTASNANIDHRKLDYIEVKHNAKTVKLCKFDYDTNYSRGGTNKGNCVSFLTGVNISGVGRYSFEYNNQYGRYPYLGTAEFDHWGYYNGHGNGLSLSESYLDLGNYLEYDSLGNETFIGDKKNPSFIDAVSGTLSRVLYPTGGFSTIEYEPHSYSKVVVRTSESEGDRTHFPFFQPTLNELFDDEIAGGVRVKRIITHLSDSIINDTTTFDYTCMNNPNRSSGILIAPPRYGIEYDTYNNTKHVEYYNLSNFMYDYNRTHIEYSQVKKTSSGQGYVIYNYSTSFEEIDREYGEVDVDYHYLLRTWNTTNYGLGSISPYPIDIRTNKKIEMALTPMASYQTKRGKLMMESYYDNAGSLLRNTTNSYNYPLIYIDTLWIVAGEIAKVSYTPRFNVELTNTTTTDYSGDIAISKTENYTYNNLGLPTTVTTNTSDGNSLRTNLYYVCDSMSNSGVIADMVESHNLAQLLKKEQYKITNGIEKLVSAERLEYYHPNSNNLSLACPIAKYSWLNGQQWKLVESYQYDDKGNLVELTDTRGIRESFLWGYKGRYPVARVNNSSFDDLNHLLNNSANTIRDMATLSDNKFIELKNLGIRTQQWNSLYSLYRYRPGVGLTEAVAPNLSTTTYQYNGYGKLTEIRDNGGHLIEQYDYNIITIEPLSASLVCDVSCYKNNELIASVKCNGGSGVYSYIWAIVKANGDTVNVLDH